MLVGGRAKRAFGRAAGSLSPKRVVKGVAHLLAAPVALPALGAAALRERRRSGRAGGRRTKPRLFWGPVAIIGIKHWSRALQGMGYESRTFVNNYFAVNARSDFDVCRSELWGGPTIADSLKAYLALAWALRRHDVFNLFFDGGLLSDTPFWWAEAPLLKVARKKIVVMPYGRDIAVPGALGPYERAMAIDYPLAHHRARTVRRRVDHFCRWADFVIANLQVGYLPRSDLRWPVQIAIDTTVWRPAEHGGTGRDEGHPVVVLHAPNHRALKGTPALVEAIDRLQADGVDVRLELIERLPNDLLRERVLAADIVVDQLLCGFGFFAVECLSLGKPVLSNVGWMSPELRQLPEMRACPIFDADAATVADVLRRLAGDAELRRTAGEQGRRWVVKYHSYEAIAATWDAIFRHVWNGEALPTGSESLC